METSTNAERTTLAVVAEARARGLLAPGDRVVVAVSGGADSTALAAILAEMAGYGLPLGLVLGHVDHGWRGRSAADADWAHVEALATRLGVRALRSPPPPPSTPRTEDAARRHRYGWLGHTARAERCSRVAVAHHLGDQAETFLMRLFRGAGVVGLSGIPWQRPLGAADVKVVRPLLGLDPAVLRVYLRTQGLSWREDPTNLDLSRDRARIRNRIGHLLESRPDAHAELARHADRLRQRVARRESEIVALAEGQLEDWRWAGAVSMPRAWLEGLGSPVLLSLALRTAGRQIHAERDGPWFTRQHVDRIASLVEQGGALELPRGLVFRVAGRRAWLFRRAQPDVAMPELDVEIVPRARFDVAGALQQGEVPSHGVSLDADRLGGKPRVRLVAAADRFTPFGRAGTHPVPVSRWLAKRSIPGFARRGTLVVEGDHGIAWVVGMRIDRGHAITDRTKRIARLHIA